MIFSNSAGWLQFRKSVSNSIINFTQYFALDTSGGIFVTKRKEFGSKVPMYKVLIKLPTLKIFFDFTYFQVISMVGVKTPMDKPLLNTLYLYVPCLN